MIACQDAVYVECDGEENVLLTEINASMYFVISVELLG